MRAKTQERKWESMAVSTASGNSSMGPATIVQDTRVEFRHASGHLGEKRPGYYLIMLRNEIRHRSLRDKPALNV